MATEFTNHTATPVGLWDTDTEHHVVAPYGGAETLEPSASAQETIDILVAAGDGATIDVEPPVNTALPTIAGDVELGGVLTASPGTWTGNPSPTFTYQWRSNGVDIVGATDQTYTIEAVGILITVEVTATNSAGSAGSATAESEQVGPVPAIPPANTVAPAITGDPELGALLTATSGEWDGSPPITYTYDWQSSPDGEDDWAAIGATVATYTLVEADEDQFVRCVVTATNVAGSDSEPSNVIGPVVSPE